MSDSTAGEEVLEKGSVEEKASEASGAGAASEVSASASPDTGGSGNHLTRGILIGLGIAFGVLLVFYVGMYAGERKAGFSYRWMKGYHRNFGGPMPGPGMRRSYFGGHGVFGEVISNKGDKLVVKGKDNIEKVVNVAKKATVVKGKDKVKLSAIKTGEWVVIIGSPGKEGQIDAKMVRVFPEDHVKMMSGGGPGKCQNKGMFPRHKGMHKGMGGRDGMRGHGGSMGGPMEMMEQPHPSPKGVF